MKVFQERVNCDKSCIGDKKANVHNIFIHFQNFGYAATTTFATLVPVVQLTICSNWIHVPWTLTWTDNNISCSEIYWDMENSCKTQNIQNVFKLPQIQLNICILTCNRYQYLLPTKTTVLLHLLRPAIAIESCYHAQKHKQFKDNKK